MCREISRVALFVCVGLLAACSPSAETDNEVAGLPLEIDVTGGRIVGVAAGENLKAYHGIRYAAPPIGDLRWAPTAPVAPWEGALDASAPGPACPQPAGEPGGFYTSELPLLDEDCLTLNVWTEADSADEARPVMVWVHGGSLTTGAGSSYPGELLASKGVVLVTINYRLGRFGFLAHPELSAEGGGFSGNQGLRDQIQALGWVRDNIASFGGDPGNVTIFGESAGSYSMSLLQASPLAKGLFHRVIGQSGAAFQPMWRLAEATTYSTSSHAMGEQFGRALVGEGTEASLEAMRAQSMNQVLATFESNPEFGNYDSLAIVDGEVIPREVAAIFADGEQADTPVMVGSTADEGTTFMSFFEPLYGSGVDGLRNYATLAMPEAADEMLAAYPASDDAEGWRALVDAFSDAIFAYPSRAWVRSMETVSSPAYLYWFTWHPPVENSETYKAFHAAEIGYVFGNLDLFGASPTDADREFSDRISDVWVQFATTGDPNGGDLPEWSAYTRDNEAYMELGPEIKAGTHLRIEQMDAIEEVFTRRRAANQATGASTGGN